MISYEEISFHDFTQEFKKTFLVKRASTNLEIHVNRVAPDRLKRAYSKSKCDSLGISRRSHLDLLYKRLRRSGKPSQKCDSHFPESENGMEIVPQVA